MTERVLPQPAGQSAFNLFGTVGIAAPPPAPAAPQPPAGDWSLPLAATVAGFVVIGWMLRRMLD